MGGKLRSIMWPAYLAALLLSLPLAPATDRGATPRSAVDRAHLGEEEPQATRRTAVVATEDDDNDQGDDV